MQLRFSIIINTYNRSSQLKQALASLKWLRYPVFEVIVVNGPSTDDSEAVIQSFGNEIKTGRCTEANLSMSRNIGLAMASGDIVCFMDDDAIPEPDWLNQLATGYTDSKIGAVGGYIRDHTGYAFQCKATICDRLGNGQSFESVEDGHPDGGARPFRFPSLTGTNSSFRRDALLAISGFDEEYVYFLDETDVIVRLLDAGYKVEYVPNAEIHHKFAPSELRNAEKIPKSIYFSVRSKAYFCIRHGAPAVTLETVMRHLETYQNGLKRDYRWYLEHGKIDPTHHGKLLDEIRRGLRDGVADAFALVKPPLLKEATLQQFTSQFRPFSSFRPAAQRLRVCFLSQDYPPGVCGGIGRWTHELATTLARDGHEVSVITRGANHPTVDFEEGVWVHRIVPTWQPKRTTPPLPDLPQIIKDYAYTAYDEAMRIHVRRGLDIISSPIWDLEGAACIAAGTIPNVLSLHSTFKLVLPSKSEWLNNPEYKAGHVDKIIEGERWALLTADHILANSRAVVSDIEQAYAISLSPDRYELVPHGIARIDSDAHRQVANEEKLKLLYVGRFEKRKGIDVLLSTLPDLLEKYPQLTVTLVGDNSIAFDGMPPPMDQFLSRHSEEPWLARVHFTGMVDDETLFSQYQTCDIFVAPSRYESFGLIFLEAMRHGKPCVGTRVGGIQEVVEDESTGLLCEVEDVNGLYERITRLLDSPALREKLGRAALEAFEKNFSNETMARRVETTYRKWSAKSGRSGS